MDSAGERAPCTDRGRRTRLKWLSVMMGLLSLLWFMLRVVPKPSRAAYPCQRAAAPLAGGFVIWIAGLAGGCRLLRMLRSAGRNRWLAPAAILLLCAALVVWLPLGITRDASAFASFTPTEPPNRPIGVAKGIHPGRVVWVHAQEATRWDGSTGDWWDDANTDGAVVGRMLSGAMQGLTGENMERQAWGALFRYFNQNRKLGAAGYRAGEKIAIKLNEAQDQMGAWSKGQGMPSPHLVYALVYDLIKMADVPGKDIVLYDASRYIGDPIYQKIRACADPEFQAVRFVVSPKTAGNGRVEASWDETHSIHFSQPGLPVAYVPQCVTEAKYLINFALLRAHTMFGVTLTAKNHFGSVYFPRNGGWTPAPLHEAGAGSRPMGSYNCLVDLIGHPQLGGKTLLYLLDGLYPAEHQQGRAIRFLSFGNKWAASLFLSQDPVAIDSVGLDFLRNEPRATQVRDNPDNYLHEAALAANPPSGTVYDPEKVGTRLASLGVHEHWNNATEKKYSRNLGRGEGIELLEAPPAANAVTAINKVP